MHADGVSATGPWRTRPRSHYSPELLAAVQQGPRGAAALPPGGARLSFTFREAPGVLSGPARGRLKRPQRFPM